jgi:flagellar hook-associated protein 1 FlgK
LGELINIKYTEGDTGLVTVTAGNTAVLVSGHSHRELYAAPNIKTENKSEGNFDIFYKATDSGTPVNITQQIRQGKLGGLIETRDNTINNLLGKVDQMAYNLAEQVNMAHSFGINRYNKPAGAFFKPLTLVGASEQITVDESIMKDVGLISAAANMNAPGDNRIANIISDIQYKGIFDSGESTIDEYYNSIVGEVGVTTAKANNELVSQGDLVNQLKNIRESISGVSLDEETAKMIEYQKGFEASARLIKTADEMMDTVLNLKRV